MPDTGKTSLGMIELAPAVFAPGHAIRIQFSRSSGPGGQNVNKINSKAELWVKVGLIAGLDERAIARLRTLAGNRLTLGDEIHLRAETERSAEANREEVFDRLRDLIVRAKIQPKTRRKTKPGKAAKQRRLTSKRQRSQTKSQRRGGLDDW